MAPVNFNPEELRTKYQIQNGFGNNLRIGGLPPQEIPPTGGSYETYTPTEENRTGLSTLVTNATLNENGSRNIHQTVNSGYGRKGITELTFVA